MNCDANAVGLSAQSSSDHSTDVLLDEKSPVLFSGATATGQSEKDKLRIIVGLSRLYNKEHEFERARWTCQNEILVTFDSTPPKCCYGFGKHPSVHATVGSI